MRESFDARKFDGENQGWGFRVQTGATPIFFFVRISDMGSDLQILIQYKKHLDVWGTFSMFDAAR